MQLSVARAPALVAERSSATPHPQHRIEAVFTASPTMRPATRFSGALLRRAVRTPLRTESPANRIVARAAVASYPTSNNVVRSFHSSITLNSIMPDAENPEPKESESHDQPTGAAELSTSEFHERADAYLNELVERLEEAQEKDPQIEVEYSVCTTVQVL
jgi:frataxin